MKTVILGPTGRGIRTVNIVTSGADELLETCRQAVTGPTGVFETVQPSASADHKFQTIIIADYDGGGAPEWLPEGAIAYVDFRAADAASVNCYAGGQIVTDINTQFAAIGNVGTVFYPETISELGLGSGADLPGPSSPSFIGDFLAAVLSPNGSRVVYTGKTDPDYPLRFGQETGDSHDYNHELDAVAGSPGVFEGGGANATSTYIYNDSDETDFAGNLLTYDAVNTIEIVTSPTLQSIQVNGGDVLTAVPAAPDSYSQIAIANTIGSMLYLQTITVYAL